MKKLSEKLLSRQEIFRGKILTLCVDEVLLENNKKSVREVVYHPGAVAILPILNDGCIILVKQFRYPIGRELLEVPAGKLDRNEDPLSCAKRELEEETGYKSESLEYFGSIYTTPGFSNEQIHLYVATNLTKGHQNLDEDELLYISVVHQEKAISMCFNGEIVDAKTIALIMLAHKKGVI